MVTSSRRIYWNRRIASTAFWYWNGSMKSTPCCPRCSTPLVLRKSGIGFYLTCPNYPGCKSPVQVLPQPPQPAYEYRQAA
jgi:hypothetical protein